MFYYHMMRKYLKFHYKVFHLKQYFHCILQLIYQLFFIYTYNFLQSKYSPISHDLSHSHSQLPGFQINSL